MELMGSMINKRLQLTKISNFVIFKKENSKVNIDLYFTDKNSVSSILEHTA
jgi:hypothetical protein